MVDVDVIRSIKNLYCVEYPGYVQNEDRMIESLNGINTISNSFVMNTSKLECRFRSFDPFCRGAIGEKSEVFNFLMKVRVRKTKKMENNDFKVECNPSVVGRVRRIIKFPNLSNFQYLPVEQNAERNLVDLSSNLNPSSMVSTSWLKEESVSFLPPPLFARIDTVQSYLTSKTSDTPGNVMGRARDRRSNYVKFVNYNCGNVPDSPNPNTLRYIRLKFITEEQVVLMKELFDKRPVWTKNALYAATKFSEVQLKYLLALSAYHFTSGPFRIAWVRFGYDPRQDPSARQFQIIDYRIRGKVQQLLQERFPGMYPKYKVKNASSREETERLSSDKANRDNTYIFKLGVYPPQRQMFYQVCDIHIPEIQDKLKNFAAKEYDSKFGWLTEEFCDEVRKTIDRYVLEALTATPAEGYSCTTESKIGVLESLQSRSSEDEMSELENDLNSDVDDDDLDSPT